MSNARLCRGLIVLLMLVEGWGCADHRIPLVTPGTDRLRVKTITQQVSGNVSVSTVSAFSYDEQGRLSSILAYQIPDSTVAPVENTVYQYDGQNRLTQVQHRVVRRGSNSETYRLTYNASGQVSGLTNLPSTFYLTPQYNPANQLSSYGKGIDVGGLFSSGGGMLTFTGNNLTTATERLTISRGGPLYSRSTSTTYTFDTKTNPFYGVFIIPAPGVFSFFAGLGAFGPFYTLYGGIDNSFNLSQNNVRSAVIADGSTTLYSYTYNAANLPISRTTTLNNSLTESLQFAYESY